MEANVNRLIPKFDQDFLGKKKKESQIWISKLVLWTGDFGPKGWFYFHLYIFILNGHK